MSKTEENDQIARPYIGGRSPGRLPRTGREWGNYRAQGCINYFLESARWGKQAACAYYTSASCYSKSLAHALTALLVRTLGIKQRSLVGDSSDVPVDYKHEIARQDAGLTDRSLTRQDAGHLLHNDSVNRLPEEKP